MLYQNLINRICSQLMDVQNIHPDDLYSLFNGKIGIAITLLCAGKSLNNDSYINKAIEYIEEANANFSQLPDTSFSNGAAGLFWGNLYFQNERIPINTITNLRDADLYFAQICNTIRNYDLFYGLIGYGQYYLMRSLSSDQNGNLQNIANKLIELSVETHNSMGNLWVYKYPYSQEQLYNLGIAHGIPSILLFLCKIYPLINDTDRKIYQTIKKTVHAFSLIQNPQSHISYFPSHINLDFSRPKYINSRLAWCYGDLGVAYSILQAGLLFHEADWISYAKELTLKSCQRDIDNSWVVDTSFCHGIAGVLYMYLKLNAYLKNPDIELSIQYWTTILLDKGGVDGGLQAFDFFINGTYVSRSSVLEGYAGIALSLLSLFDKSTDNKWDAMFLL